MRGLIAIVAALAVLGIPAAASAHEGPPVDASTDVGSLSVSVPFTGCDGTSGVANLDLRFRVHLTQFADGHFVFLGSDWGSFEFVPDVGRTVSGRYHNGGVTVVTQNSYVSNSVSVNAGKFEDGEPAVFRIRTHYTWANGEVRAENVDVICPALTTP